MTDSADDPRKAASEVPTRTAAPPPDPPPPAVPRTIGGFEIRRQIDAGGMGIVYEAVQAEPRRTVALKVMRRGLASKSAQRRFEYESQLLARLSHPGIAVVYDAGTHREHGEDVPYFAMEYIAGARHLTTYCASHGLTLEQRLAIMADVCDAVHHAHLKGIVHRDLKPANVLVGSSGTPKVIDFGVARALDSDLAPATQQTDIGQVVGTLQYMSPEQVAGDPHEIDARSDVYALGLILHELVTGRLPYDVTGLSTPAAVALIREGGRPSSGTGQSTGQALRGDLKRVVLKAIERDRIRRYASADALARDLRHILAAEPVEAHPPTLSYLIGSAARRQIRAHSWTTLVLVAIAVMTLAHFAFSEVVFRWAPGLAKAFETQAARALPSPASVPGLERVRIVAIEDGTDFEALARSAGVEGVSNDNLFSLRRLHGEFMKRLASADAAAVAWDIFFTAPTAYDGDLRAGIESLLAARTRVVLGVGTWDMDAAGAPALSPGLAAIPGVWWGGCTYSKDPQMSLDAAVRADPAAPVPSLALLGAALSRRYAEEFTVSMDPVRDEVRFHRWRPHPVIPNARAPDGAPETWRVTSVQREVLDSTAGETGVQRGAYLALCTVPIPENKAFAGDSIGYAEAFLAPPESLRSLCRDRIVLIGDKRAASGDFVNLPDGRRVWGCHLQATGIAALLSGRYAKVPHTGASFALTGAGAVFGVLFAIAATNRGWVLAILLVAGGAAAVILSLVVYRYWLVLANPTIPILAMVLAGGVSAGILRLRRIGAP